MIKQIISYIVWISLVLCCFAVSKIEVPKECTVGAPDYNETLCNETCTKDIHTSQPYCANFTLQTATVPTQPQEQEVPNLDTVPESKKLQEVMRNDDPSTPKFHIDAPSSGISLGSSLIFSVLCFLLTITF